jgi:hypothetical protein
VQDREVERVNRLLNVQDYHDGEDIVTEGTRGDKFFMMVQGEAFAFRQDAGGVSVPLMRYRRGGYFGEVSLLTGDPRGATVRASGPVRAAFLDWQAFLELPERTRRALQDRMVLYDKDKGLRVSVENSPQGAEGYTRVSVSTVSADFGQGGLLSKMITRLAALKPAWSTPRSAPTASRARCATPSTSSRAIAPWCARTCSTRCAPRWRSCSSRVCARARRRRARQFPPSSAACLRRR